jgi:hypothetical protein
MTPQDFWEYFFALPVVHYSDYFVKWWSRSGVPIQIIQGHSAAKDRFMLLLALLTKMLLSNKASIIYVQNCQFPEKEN